MRTIKILGFTLLGITMTATALWRIGRQPKFQFFGDLLYRVDTPDKVVALTFDDGPSPNNTEDVLRILSENKIHATFFMIGKNIERFPALARRVFEGGHQLANHSYSHQRMLTQSIGFCRDEIEATDALIRSVGYKDEIVFRPPYGNKLFSLPLALKSLNKLTVTWDVESEDTDTQDAMHLQNRVLQNTQPGSIILFHDGNAHKEGTLSAVKLIISDLKSKGFMFLTVNELREHSQKREQDRK